MRYQLWDVLLFPEPSNVPIQEFKTACFVTQDAGIDALQQLFYSCAYSACVREQWANPYYDHVRAFAASRLFVSSINPFLGRSEAVASCRSLQGGW